MTDKRHLSKTEVVALRGLRLPVIALKSIRKAGIYCEPAVSIEYRQAAGEYVLRARESGGAVAEIGAYCGFVAASGAGLAPRMHIDSLGVNGLHAVVAAPQLVRIQMFRYQQTYELLITEHRLTPVVARKRPVLENRILFHGRDGRLRSEYVGHEATLGDTAEPQFYTRGGDLIACPRKFQAALRSITVAVNCVGCRHSHLSVVALEATQSGSEANFMVSTTGSIS
jgi:hypothetical protein